MFIAQAYQSRFEFWRYMMGSVVVFLASIVGQLPLVILVGRVARDKKIPLTDLEDPAIFMKVLDANLTFFLTLISFAIGMVALMLWVKHSHMFAMKKIVTTRSKVDWGRVLFGFLIVTVVNVAMIYWDYSSNPENYELQFDLSRFLILALIAITLIPIQTSLEEFLFRGYLMQGFGLLAGNRWFPLVLTSLIFGGLHYSNPEVDKIGDIALVYYIGTGFFLGIITLLDEGMELALGFHAGNNLVAALLVTTDWTVFQTDSILLDKSEPAAGFAILMPVFVIYPIYLLIMHWRYRWTNCSDKLFGKLPAAPERDPLDYL